MSRLGTFRAVYLVALCCVGSFLFAYDTGIIGGILTFEGFQEDFRYGPAQKASVGSNSTSLLQAGAFFSCFFIWPFTAKYGRRWSIILASAIFCAGAIVQTINTHSLAAFYVARVVSGVGVGMATVVIPMYSAEMAPKNIRGMLGSMFQFFFTMGVMTSYFVDYGVSKHVKASTRQWQIPVGLQLVPDAPQVFAAVGAGQNNLLITGFFGLVKVVSCLFYLLFLVERIGRRGSLLGGAFLMGTYMLIIACLTATHPPKSVDQGLTSTAIASMTMIYLEAMSYNISWGPAPWVYMGEIFPSRIREAGIAIGTSTQWLFNFVFSQATPHAVQNLGWKTFLMFCIFNWALVLFVWFFIKETKGKSLEEMDALFSRKIIGSDAESSLEKQSKDGDATRVPQDIDRKE
ncbi:quinate permease [Colletotrichum tofieldiae]|nr:quinate permease [Colletotrichum tofieldiae]